jgi:glycosyltransferase involved in cell wall biosynthesis
MNKCKMIDYVVSTYLHADEKQPRCGSPAAVNLAEYVIHDLLEDGYQVSVVSPSWTMAKKGIYHGKVITISEKLSYRFFSSFGAKHNQLKQLWSCFQLSLFLFFKGSSTIIAYHSGRYLPHALFFWRLSHPHGTLILQIGEVYADVFHRSQKERDKELHFLNKGDRFVFSSSDLEQLINNEKKPFAVIQGAYLGMPQMVEKKHDGLVHIVYSGTLNPEKGAFLAVSAAEFLPSNYVIHILGNDDSQELERMKRTASELQNSKGTHALITFEGVLLGDMYSRFLQSCDIGLIPQDMHAVLNATSFPSKTFAYLSNGLHVLSARIPAIEHSTVGSHLFYYDDQSPKGMADAILKIDLSSPNDGRTVLERLHREAMFSLSQLLR